MNQIVDMHQLRVITNSMKRNYFIIMPAILKVHVAGSRENSRRDATQRKAEEKTTLSPGKNKKCTQSVKHWENGIVFDPCTR